MTSPASKKRTHRAEEAMSHYTVAGIQTWNSFLSHTMSTAVHQRFGNTGALLIVSNTGKTSECSFPCISSLLDHPLEILQILRIDVMLIKRTEFCLPRSRHFKRALACINSVFRVSYESAIASLLLCTIWVGERKYDYSRESVKQVLGEGSLTYLQKSSYQDSCHLIHE